MQPMLLTDDELLLAIAENTDAMSALVCERAELEAGVGEPTDANSWLMQSNAQKIHTFERQYQEYTNELRRRCA